MERTYRACLSSYIVLTICFAVLPAVTLPMALRGDRGAAGVVVAGISSIIFMYFWLSRFKLTITPDTLVYASLFTGERHINLSEVSDREMIFQSAGRYGGRYLLAVTARGITTRINFKVFSREAASALFHVLGPNQALESTATG